MGLMTTLIPIWAALAAAGAGEPARELRFGGGEAWTIRKVPVVDCRVVRGFLGTPADGSVRSWDYRGSVREYPKSASDGVAYAFNSNDGLHLTLADAEGFDAVVLRGGARTRLYADGGSLVEPNDAKPLAAFQGPGPVETIRLPQRVRERNVVLFGAEGGQIADVSFYRLAKGPVPHEGPSWAVHVAGPPVALPPPAGPFAPESVARAMAERYGRDAQTVLALRRAAADEPDRPVQFAKGRPVHFISAPFEAEAGLAAISLEGALAGADGPVRMTVAVQDPLDPRLDLAWVEVALERAERACLVADIPDQVLPPGSRVWVTLSFDRDVTLGGPGGGGPRWALQLVPRRQALPEALARRKFLLKTFFALLSEPRPWGAFRKQPPEQFFASSPYAAQCPELFMTLDQCWALDPNDDLVRQCREWVYVGRLEQLSEVSPPPAPPAGVPPWAWYPRLAWLEVRRIAQWWLDERLVATGEFGGRVGDDTDMYQQYADLPFFEDGGTAAALKDAAAGLAELADRQNLRDGLNRNSTDALHAYEEGINHLALMGRWSYGDPVYLERCMDSARNLVHLTVRTEDGRRLFRDRENMGARDVQQPRPPAVDGHATPLMWHAALQLADYNRNPQALALMREWADTWLAYMKPGAWATAVEVRTGKVLEAEKDRPLYGGYRTQACVFTWLAQLTGEARYVGPFLHYSGRAQAPSPLNGFLGELHCLGFLDGLDAGTVQKLAAASPALWLYVKGDPQPLVQAAIGRPRSTHAGIGTLYDARRWPDMYTTTHQFTDRVFPDLLEHASIAYLGGFTRRNKLNPTQAVSWEGLGTQYAALVMRNRADGLKALVYSYADRPLRGTMRIWALEHGRYRLQVGPDADGDGNADRAERSETMELARADAVPFVLPPRQVAVIELRQTEKLDPVLARPDLALARREIAVRDGLVEGLVHNVGAADAVAAEVAIVDAGGRILARQDVGPLPAPLDLVPKRKPFQLRLPGPAQPGWRIVADPDRRIAEIYEGNNEAPLP